MEYLQPLKTLESKVTLYRNLLIFTGLALLTSLVVTPMVMTGGNAFVIQTDAGSVLSKNEPWRPTVARIEGFRDYYLKSRFEWNEANFDEKKKALRQAVTENVNAKLKDSLSAFESLVKSQKARSYYVFEGYGFSNDKHQLEVRIDRVLRIGKVAVATPLVIKLEFKDVPLTPENPYGLQITSLSESEVN